MSLTARECRGSQRQRGGRTRTATVLLALLVPAAVPASAALASEHPPYWSGPIPVDAEAAESTWNGLACTAPALCVAVDGGGNVLTTTDPSGGERAWTRTHLQGLGETSEYPKGQVSCASSDLCALVGAPAGSVFVSTDPLGGAATWREETIDTVGALRDVACVAPSLCVATGEHGEVLASTEPGSGAGAWKLLHIDGAEAIASVSCATATLCVAVDGSGNVLTSSEPSSEWSATSLPWPTPPVPDQVAAVHVACVQGPLCVVGGESAIFASTDPGGGASAWTAAAGVDASGGVSCAAPSRCVAFSANSDAEMLTSGEPTGGAATWTPDGVGQRFISALSCISSSSCVAVGSYGDVFASTAAHLLSVALQGGASGSVESTAISCPFLTCSHEVPGIIQPAPLEQVTCSDAYPFGPGDQGTCELDYPSSDKTTLTATPASGAIFTGWTGACSGISACTLPMSEDRALTATFVSAASLGRATPRISSLRESHRAFTVGPKRTPLRAVTAARSRHGTVFSFELNVPATVEIEIEAARRGARVANRCVPVGAAAPHASRCTRYARIATLARTAHGGLNSVAFSGRLRTRTVAAGAYRAAFTAADSSGRSAASYLSFTVLGR